MILLSTHFMLAVCNLNVLHSQDTKTVHLVHFRLLFSRTILQFAGIADQCSSHNQDKK